MIDPRALARDAAALVEVPSVTGDERAALGRLVELALALGLRADLHEHDLAALRAHPDHPGEEVQGSFTGDGPIDAVFRAINAATGLDARLREFRVDAVTGGQDALGEVSVVVELGAHAGERVGLPGVLLRERATGAGQAVTTDIIEAAGIAYARALTNAVRRIQDQAAEDIEPTPELATP